MATKLEEVYEGNKLLRITEKYPPMPIIVGAARSGTTLLRLMLDAHPELSIPSETRFVPELLKLEGKPQFLREQFYQIITKQRRWQEFNLSKTLLSDNLARIEPFTISQGLRCFYKLYADRFKKQRWGEKTPAYILHINDIQAILPEAHFIHIIRDGRDVALSMKKVWWGVGDDMEAQAIQWVWRIREARQQAQFTPNYLEVHYEELIRNPTKVLKQICEFIHLSYHPAMENYYQSASTRLSEFVDIYKPDGKIFATRKQRITIHRNTSQPPNPGKIGRWRREMSTEERIKYEAIAGSWLRDFGYETLT